MTNEILDDQLRKSAIHGVEKHYLEAFFGSQRGYYVETYDDFHKGKRFTFNIGSFFFGVFWMMYRKLFWEMLLGLMMLFGIGIVEGVVYILYDVQEPQQKAINLAVMITTGIMFGFAGNYLYMKHTDSKIHSILLSSDDEVTRLNMLKKKGGISFLPFIILALLIIAIALYPPLLKSLL